MASIQRRAWQWAKALCQGSTSSYQPEWGISLAAYHTAWDVVNALSEAERRRPDFSIEMAQAIIEKHLVACQKQATNFLFELELQDSFDDPSQNEERRYRYIVRCFRKPESKVSSSMADSTNHDTDIPLLGDYVPPKPWYYLFPRELEGDYEALLAWANDYYAQAIEVLERMKAELFA